MGSFGNNRLGNQAGETAKSLPACKAALSRAFCRKDIFAQKALEREPQEVDGNIHPRYMIIREVILDRIRLTCTQRHLEIGAFVYGILFLYKRFNNQVVFYGAKYFFAASDSVY